MSAAQTTPTAASLAGPLAERQLALLGRLNEIGMDVAEAVGRRARAATEQDDLAGVAMACSRVARAVRQTVLLESKVVADLDALEAGTARRASDAAKAADEALTLAQNNHKARVERIVERAAVARHGEDEERVDRLVAEAAERLDDVDMYGDVLSRPVSELVDEICAALDLEPDWPRGVREAWSAPPPSPRRGPSPGAGQDACSPAARGSCPEGTEGARLSHAAPDPPLTEPLPLASDVPFESASSFAESLPP